MNITIESNRKKEEEPQEKLFLKLITFSFNIKDVPLRA